ncbi:MAG: hypothetical protein CMJ59_04605 [Planctomycetaceae bacterium]|nr:hypothetical protein [Planctomycetaceae bacterium]
MRAGAAAQTLGSSRKATLPSSQTADGCKSCRLRTQFERAVERAGVATWAKPFQNLRASRETELAVGHPQHAVTE